MTRQLSTEVMAGTEVPAANADGWEYLSTPRFFMYQHAAHTERDLLRPGYFDSIVAGDPNRYHGALVIYTAEGGHREPESWQTGILRICEVRGARGIAANQPTVVATIQRFGKATAVRHDAEPEQQAA